MSLAKASKALGATGSSESLQRVLLRALLRSSAVAFCPRSCEQHTRNPRLD